MDEQVLICEDNFINGKKKKKCWNDYDYKLLLSIAPLELGQGLKMMQDLECNGFK